MPGSDAPGTVKAMLRLGLAALAAALLLFVVPVPCVFYEPGKVVPVGELVTVETAGRPTPAVGPEPPERPNRRGGWLLTTVYLEPRANLWSVAASAWRADREVHTRKSVFQGSSAEEYAARMGVLMEASHGMAVEAAFRAAGVRYEAVPEGVVVARGGGRLKAGDRITAVDGAAVGGLAALSEALRARAGREAELTVLRGGNELTVKLAVDKAGAGDSPKLPGGAEPAEIRRIRAEEPGTGVTIDAGGFGGPSAGLALALHIYEQLTGESLTDGRRIAATGTIEPTGAVGAVGGVRLKTIAASRAGADLFLVPEASAAEAAAAAEAEGGGMAVAGVGTLEEAIGLLRASK